MTSVGLYRVPGHAGETEGMKSPTNSQGVAVLSGSLDLSISWGFLDKI